MSRSSAGTQTSRTEIDPEVKQAYLQNLQQAQGVAAALPARQFAEFNPLYAAGERQLTNIGLTPFTGEEITAFQNPYEQQVVQNTLQDIEDQRRMGQIAEAQRATAARAFGGSRQGIQRGLVDAAALRQAATTAANLRQQGYGQAAQLAQQARQIGRQGAFDVLGLGGARQALAQQQLDALRNIGLERLGIAQSGLSLNLPNLGMTQSTPLYQNRAAGTLGGALAGAQLASAMPSLGISTEMGAGLGGLLGFL
jgi:hypothetical protein